MNTIAERIKFAMKAKNKKQVDIVKDTGISKGAFSSYLSGQYNPKADKMELIADSLDVDLRWLYGQNVPMEHTSQHDNALQYVCLLYTSVMFPYIEVSFVQKALDCILLHFLSHCHNS